MSESTANFPEFLYHATSRENLDSILNHGITCSNYGAVHGCMDYRPPSNAVYLSKHEQSSNLHGNLFSRDGKDQEVIVLRIRASDLDSKLFYPDDAFFYMFDEIFYGDAEDIVGDPDELAEYIGEMTPKFCNMFGLDESDGARFLEKFLVCDGSLEAYSKIGSEMGGARYLVAQGEAAYLGDVPSSAIVDWDFHPNSLRATPEKRGIRPN